MTAVQLGPFVLSAPRFAAIVGLVAFLITAQLLSRKRPALADWAWTSAMLVFLGARIGFVLENLGAYLREPLTILYFWQGGFSPLWGLVAAAAYTFTRIELRRHALPAIVLGLAAWGGTQLILTPVRSEQVVLPNMPLTTLADQQGTDLQAVAAGRPMVLNLWAPWCLPCRRETPMVLDVAQSHPDTVFALADQATAVGSVRAFLDERGLAYDHVYLDTGARLGLNLGAAGLPTTYFFAADGSLVHTHVGEVSRAELERRVRQVQAVSSEATAPEAGQRQR